MLGQIVFAKCIIPLQRELSQRRAEILRQYGMDEAPVLAERVIDVRSVNNAEIVTLLQKLSPQVIVVNGTRILEEKVLNAVPGIF